MTMSMTSMVSMVTMTFMACIVVMTGAFLAFTTTAILALFQRATLGSADRTTRLFGTCLAISAGLIAGNLLAAAALTGVIGDTARSRTCDTRLSIPAAIQERTSRNRTSQHDNEHKNDTLPRSTATATA
jgi:hypothetical protein